MGAFSHEEDYFEEFRELYEYVPETKTTIPKKYFPVGTDISGMYLLMDISPEKFGTIWAWHKSTDPWGKGDNLYIGFVADSYEDFLFNRLQEPTEDW
ncbi:MAG: hypothetical protein CR993_04645 [Rhodobacterales bacterium]|nr:MAG: hypothetical protein CR993_04645 [Rhodobacterales bacterium]